MDGRRSRTLDDEENQTEDIQTDYCAGCGTPRGAWTARRGKGYEVEDELYCCKNCSEKTGCVCADLSHGTTHEEADDEDVVPAKPTARTKA